MLKDEAKIILGFENYSVSKKGKVFNKNGHALKETFDKHGYKTVVLYKNGKQNRKKIHSLVLSAYAGVRPTGYVCRHLDGDKLNNCINNLAWGTQKENLDDKILHGTHIFGERVYNVVKSDIEVEKIKECAVKFGVVFAANAFGTTKNVVFNYVTGKSRADVRPDLTAFYLSEKKKQRILFSEEMINKAKEMAANGSTQREISKHLGISQCHISRIVSGKRRPLNASCN